MSNGYIQVPPDSTGKKVQTFENTIGGNVVEAEAVALVDTAGQSILGTAGSPNADVLTVQGIVGGTVIPISGTVTSNQGSPNTVANAWPVEITNGTNILGTPTNPVRVDPTGTTVQPVSGTVTTAPPANASTNITEWDSTVLGAPSAYGTSPGAVTVPGVNAYITNTPAVTLASTTITGSVTVAGAKTNNNAAPDGNNLGVLPALANASAPTWTEGDQVLLSENLAGMLRVAAFGVSGAANDGFSNSQTLPSNAQNTQLFSFNYPFLYNGSTWDRQRAPHIFRTAQATASGNTAVWTPTSGKKFRLLKLFVEVTDNSSLAAGAVLTLNFQDATTSINISFDVFVPTTAVTTVIGDGLEQELDLGDVGILSAAANNVLNVNLSAALATGNVRVIAMGTEE